MYLFKQQSVSVEELSADSCPVEISCLKQIFSREAKLQGQMC